MGIWFQPKNVNSWNAYVVFIRKKPSSGSCCDWFEDFKNSRCETNQSESVQFNCCTLGKSQSNRVGRLSTIRWFFKLSPRPFVRKLINKFDYEALDIKMLKAKVSREWWARFRLFLSPITRNCSIWWRIKVKNRRRKAMYRSGRYASN